MDVKGKKNVNDCALTMPVCVVNISRKWFKMPKRTVGLFSFFKALFKSVFLMNDLLIL